MQITHQDLVQDSVSSTTAITRRATSRLGDRIQLIKEHDTWGGSSSLVEDVSDIGLGFTEPHGEKLGTFDGDEVGLTLIGNATLQSASWTTIGLE